MSGLQQFLQAAAGEIPNTGNLYAFLQALAAQADVVQPQAFGRLTTLDNVGTAVPSAAVAVPLNASARVTAVVVGETPAGLQVYSSWVSQVFRHPATGLVNEGAIQAVVAAVATGGFAPGGATFVVVGNHVQVFVAGVAATDVRWRVQVSADVVTVP